MRRASVIALLLLLVAAGQARAQLGGNINLGAAGAGSGTQPAPGVYVGLFLFRHAADTMVGADGRILVPESGQPSGITGRGSSPFLFYVSKRKILGADYAVLFAPTVAAASIEGGEPGSSRSIGAGIGDLYCVPVSLGWHAGRADVTASVGLYAPTARYTAGGDSNLGSGAWGYELSGGTTLFLDAAKRWSFATSAYWELHGRTTDNVRAGQILSLQGGVGKAYLQGALRFAVAYYAQWKLTGDRLDRPAGPPPSSTSEDRHRVFAVGPDLALPVVAGSKLIALLNVRYLKEFGARATRQGSTLVLALIFPVPSLAIR